MRSASSQRILIEMSDDVFLDGSQPTTIRTRILKLGDKKGGTKFRILSQ